MWSTHHTVQWHRRDQQILHAITIMIFMNLNQILNVWNKRGNFHIISNS